MTVKSAVIIGGGIGGLFTGAILARNGIKVTVLEKNAIIGGGLQCFTRRQKTYETGMHVMGGFEPGGSLHKICTYLGILHRLDLHHISPDCMDELRYDSTGERFLIPSGREAFTRRMAEYFPHEAEGVRAYVDKLFALTEEVHMFYLREHTPDHLQPHSEEFLWSADQLIAHYISDPRLREILAYLNPLYGGVEGRTPAYIHALINVLYINGASRFAGGSQQLADALRSVIEENGGSVEAPCEVSCIAVTNRTVQYVESADGRRFTADAYISSVHPTEMLRLLPSNPFTRVFTNRLREIPNSYSAFSLYIDLKPERLPYIDHTCYYVKDFNSMWTQREFDPADWPRGFMYMTPPEARQGEFASRMLVHCIMSYDCVTPWEHTSVGRRGESYEAWKRECTSRVLAKLERVIPGFSDMVQEVYAASPLTVRDFYHTPRGAIFGYMKDCTNYLFSQMSVFTKVRNLFLTGQNINLHGICGVPLTAVNTAEAILGPNAVIRQINEFYNK